MNVLILSPHPDDETIGCGGAIALHRLAGDAVCVLSLTSGELGLSEHPIEEARAIRERELSNSAGILDFSVVESLRLPDYELARHLPAASTALARWLGKLLPERVYLPHPADDHPDHQACLPLLARAIQIAGVSAPWALGYEIWSPLPEFDHVEDISSVFSTKLAAVRAYSSQLESFRYDRAITGLNQYRGELAGKCEYAEVFVSLDTEPGECGESGGE